MVYKPQYCFIYFKYIYYTLYSKLMKNLIHVLKYNIKIKQIFNRMFVGRYKCIKYI